jgi:hypothetical protein
MTAIAPADRAAASRLIAALEHAWSAIRSHHPEVPQVVIVVASGSDARSRRLNLGHFAAGRWQLTNQPTDRAEVLVSGEGLHRGPVDVLGTLLHEAAHGLAYARKISDTSRQGRYHNRCYATLARELGLDVAHLDPSAGQRPASPSRPPPAMSRRWPSWARRWCCGAGPSGPAQPARAGPATPLPARVAVAGGFEWPARCWSRHQSCALPAPSRSSQRTTRSLDAYQPVAETSCRCRGGGSGLVA